jgi:hypothetical protein
VGVLSCKVVRMGLGRLGGSNLLISTLTLTHKLKITIVLTF